MYFCFPYPVLFTFCCPMACRLICISYIPLCPWSHGGDPVPEPVEQEQPEPETSYEEQYVPETQKEPSFHQLTHGYPYMEPLYNESQYEGLKYRG